ncbi:MAG: hypothetical protein ACK2UU_08535 [Anaerolineae bacterium]|jgi:hypothetical protein
MSEDQISQLESRLNSFEAEIRAAALRDLLALAEAGEIDLPAHSDVANMHCHSFFSFNAYGHSPTSIAWLAKRHGWRAAGIVDFDVLDGVDEFLAACEQAAVRGSTGIETRVFVPEYADQEINSPGEPGVCYHMGIGFASDQVPAAVAPILADLGQRADVRNQAILARVNPYLDPVSIDYEADVLPLTPAGHPTERHMVAAYIQAAEKTVPDPTAFWAEKLDVALDQMATIMANAPRYQNLIRARLMKRGGVGYIQPKSGMFPSLEQFHRLIVACGALPCAAWLDGTTTVERDPEEWMGFLIDKGVVALNIIPDRNWYIADPSVKQTKVQNLYHIVEVAQQLDLLLNVGTEMNSFGQKQADDFSAPELAPVRDAFFEGAYAVYGHTAMQRILGLGYQSEWAQAHLPSRCERNRFYTRIGRQTPPGREGRTFLESLDATLTPGEMLARLTQDRGWGLETV